MQMRVQCAMRCELWPASIDSLQQSCDDVTLVKVDFQQPRWTKYIVYNFWYSTLFRQLLGQNNISLVTISADQKFVVGDNFRTLDAHQACVLIATQAITNLTKVAPQNRNERKDCPSNQYRSLHIITNGTVCYTRPTVNVSGKATLSVIGRQLKVTQGLRMGSPESDENLHSLRTWEW